MVKKAIKITAITELFIVATSIISFELFINLQVAFLSSFFVIVGSSFAYSKLVDAEVEANHAKPDRDLLDSIEDPHELYEDFEIDETPADEVDLVKVVKEERGKIKTFSMSSIKKGAKGGSSLYRLGAYLFLILGFIALKNNEVLHIGYYLASLTIGIVVGSLIVRDFKTE